MLEDFAAMEKAAAALPERAPLLLELGERFAVLGMHEQVRHKAVLRLRGGNRLTEWGLVQAVMAYSRAGDIKGAIDCCVQLNQASPLSILPRSSRVWRVCDGIDLTVTGPTVGHRGRAGGTTQLPRHRRYLLVPI
jgi:hypothetical protein